MAKLKIKKTKQFSILHIKSHIYCRKVVQQCADIQNGLHTSNIGKASQLLSIYTPRKQECHLSFPHSWRRKQLSSGVPKLFLPLRMLRKVSWLKSAIWSQIFWLLLPLLLFILNISLKCIIYLITSQLRRIQSV